MSEGATYKDAGVDIRAGYEAVRRIKAQAASTRRPEVLADIGSFGGFFALGAQYQDPVLVSGTDGVGTKLKIAFIMDKHDTIGIDCVAYCVNDIVCHGAEPLFFLDYLAVGRLAPEQVEAIVGGVAAGCRAAGCALIGGETAEMPGFYAPGEYDIAGFVVGAVERSQVINGSTVAPGDIVVAVGSTGLQSSGFSLVRRVVFDVMGMSPETYVEDFGRTLGEELLEPTGVYARLVKNLTAQVPVHGIANISGGGLPENLPRAMGENQVAVIERKRWEVPTVFRFIQRGGKISDTEMFNTFNMGVGMAVIVPEAAVDNTLDIIGQAGSHGFVIGRIERGEGGVRID